MGILIERAEISLCQHCWCMTKTLEDLKGNRFCAKCKEPK